MADTSKTIVSYSIALGVSIALKMRSPKSDYVSITRACKYLSEAGYLNARKVIDTYIAQGRMNALKKGDGKNSKSMISIVELNRSIIEDLINNRYGRE